MTFLWWFYYIPVLLYSLYGEVLGSIQYAASSRGLQRDVVISVFSVLLSQ